MNYTLNVSPQVRSIIQPIIEEMTHINMSERMQPMLMATPQQETPAVKQAKCKCVHYIVENNTITSALDWVDDNGTQILMCKACGRPINTKFDSTSVKAIKDTISVVNSLLVILLTNGVRPEVCNTLLSLKVCLPEISQLCQTVNEYVKQDEKNTEPERNLGVQYRPLSSAITGF